MLWTRARGKRKSMWVGWRSRAIDRFLPCLYPEGTLCEFQNKCMAVKKRNWGKLPKFVSAHIPYTGPEYPSWRKTGRCAAQRASRRFGHCRWWMDLSEELISGIYQVPFNQGAQNAIISTISLILTKHLWGRRKKNGLYVVSLDPWACHSKEINLLEQKTDQLGEVN